MKFPNPILTLTSFFARNLPDSIKRALYANEAMANLVRQSLNRAAPQGVSEVTIAAGGNKDLKMLLDLQSEKDYWLGTYEPDLQAVIADLVKPGNVVYDIGANIGYVTLLFARRTSQKGHVYAFEALPGNVTRLEKNIALNHYSAIVTIIPAAVQDRSSQAEFWVGPSDGMGKVAGSAGRLSVDYPQKLQVTGLALDDFYKEGAVHIPDIIKIDIEGGEVLALPGMIELLREHRPILMVELHGEEASRVVWDLLILENYRICMMDPGYKQISDVQELKWKSYIVAFPND